MKYLIVILVVVVAGWLLLRGRGSGRQVRRGDTAGANPQAMVQCAHCGVHLPRGDAVEDRLGVYCSEAHRLAGPNSP
jgi:uncharacterized protein